MHGTIRRLSILFVLTLALAPNLAADVLVTLDGSRVVTDGPWEVKGRQILFRLPNGTLSSMRASEIDLEASRLATEEANRPAAAPAAPAAPDRRAPVLVITDKDIGQAASDVLDQAAAAVGQGNVRVIESSYTPLGGDPAYEVTGSLRNDGASPVEGVELYVEMTGVDEAGEAVEDRKMLRQVQLDSTSLDAGEATEFRYQVSRSDLLGSGGAQYFANPNIGFDVRFRDTVPAGGADDSEDEEGDEEEIGFGEGEG